MGRAPYECTLWQDRAGRFADRGHEFAVRKKVWLDLQDDANGTETTDLITRYGGRDRDIQQYRPEIRDQGAGESLTEISLQLCNLTTVRTGERASDPNLYVQLTPIHLAASDEILDRELLH